MGFLLDTSALSEPVRMNPRPQFMQRLRQVPSSELFTSTVCLMELRYGCAVKGDPDLWRRLEENLLNSIPGLPFGIEEAVRCGDLLAELSKKGTPIGMEDTQIAATALVHNHSVVTFNTKHFELIPGLHVENWL